MADSHLEKCSCCDNCVLFVCSSLAHGDCDGRQMIPVADLSAQDLRCLATQIFAQLKGFKND